VELDVLRRVGLKLCEVPEGFVLHPQLQKILAAKKVTVEEGKNIDWGTAEALAFGTLLLEGNHVRLSGQDVERGTFSHRHAVLHDQKTGDRFVPLNTLTALADPSAPRHMTPDPSVQAKFTVRNSILSEYGVLGFEHGYSLENPNALILWEAQFGDFMNGAQIMIDQFISAGEDKWLRQSGLTMLLPHGYDGQGAEHSSARMERFLSIVDEDANFVPPMGNDERMQIQHTNWQVVNCSTPANYFHVLRRQIHRDFRKPLVVFSPKNLLRHRLCVSDIEHMGPGTRFHRVYRERDPEVTANPEKVRRLVFCTGKIYYELLQQRQDKGLKDIAIVRIEQLAPFPFDYVARECARFPNAEVVWAQEEPQNMGAWHFVRPRIHTANRDLNKRNVDVTYYGRLAAAAPATGLGTKVHQREQQAILDAVIQ
jgi:2-oxoglutarate dehydrogenase E1 component